MGTAAHAAEVAGTVAALDGPADVQHAGATTPAPLKPADDVFLGDRLHTGENSRARLALRDDSVITLAPDSELELTAQLVGPAKATAHLGLAAGAARAVVPDRYGTPGSQFDVTTPTAVAGVRGTSFLIVFDVRRRLTRVLGITHRTWVRGRRDTAGKYEVVVGPDELTEVPENGRPSRPHKLKAAEVKALLALTATVTGGLEPDVELTPGGETPPTGRVGSGAIDDPTLLQRPGDKTRSKDSLVVDQPLDRIDRQPSIPPIPPTKR